MKKLADAEARHRIQAEFGSTLFVEAAAGTGKTTALVGRIIGLIRSGTTTLARIVAVTFTEKAAGEMKLRLRAEIEKARTNVGPAELARFDQALEELELARIGTIHAFCGDLLHERPIEARIDPLFAVASEEETKGLIDQAFDGWFQNALSAPPEGIRRLLRRVGGDPPREQLRAALHTLCEHRDFPCRWRRDPFDRNQRIDELVIELADLGRLSSRSSRWNDTLTNNLRGIDRFVSEATRLEKAAPRDHDGLEAELRDLPRRVYGWHLKGTASTKYGDLSRDEVLARRDDAKSALNDFIKASDADLAPLLHEALLPAVANYEDLKAKAGRLDFLDLLIKARDLLRDDASVRADFQRRFTHYFIDEVQDTDPLQVEIMLLLAANDPDESDWRKARPCDGKLFLVGDPKQSLYRFRRADIAIYQHLKKRLLEVGGQLLQLTTSFRSPPSIQAFVNGAFAPAMAASEPGTQADYVALTPARLETTGQPTLIALPVPRPYSASGNITKGSIEASFPDAAAAFIDWLVNESGWTVDEKGERVPVRPRHIAVLFKRFRSFGADITRPYVRGLEARRVPHVLIGGCSFHDREEVMALRNALVATEWPDDELRVFATLRGPFFAIGDAALLAYRQYVDADGAVRTRRLDPTRKVDRSSISNEAVPVADALDMLRRLHRGRNHRPISQTIATLLEEVRAHAGIALWPTGEQALGNCQRLIDMARAFESKASSFRAFVEDLETASGGGQTAEAPIVEEGTEGVRLMTVHKAKGLEFPVVILADPTCPMARATPSRHVDPERHLWLETICGCAPIELLEAQDEELARDRSEAIRVAYVAATRAQDLLVLPSCGDRQISGWLEALNPMTHHEGERTATVRGPGCPEFETDSVLDRGGNNMPPEGCVRPGGHRPQVNGPEIVWWGPSALRLDVPLQTPLRQQQILQLDPVGTATAASEMAYHNWRRSREAALQSAARSSVSIEIATLLTRAAAETTDIATADDLDGDHSSSTGQDVSIEIIARPRKERPGGRRFGTLVHAILATIDLHADTSAIAETCETNGRILGATREEMSAATETVEAALEHPIFARARQAHADGNVRREVPLSLALENGSLVEGVVDLAFQEGARWTVVDFKTDREFKRNARSYELQVSLYSRAVTASTGLLCNASIMVL